MSDLIELIRRSKNVVEGCCPDVLDEGTNKEIHCASQYLSALPLYLLGNFHVSVTLVFFRVNCFCSLIKFSSSKSVSVPHVDSHSECYTV